MKISDFSSCLKKIDPELARRTNISKLEIDSLSASRVPFDFGKVRFVLSMIEGDQGEIDEVEVYGSQHYKIMVEEASKVCTLAEVAHKYDICLKVLGKKEEGKVCTFYAQPRLFVEGDLEEVTSRVISAQDSIDYVLKEFAEERSALLEEDRAIKARQVAQRALDRPNKSETIRRSRKDNYNSFERTCFGYITEKDYILKVIEEHRTPEGGVKDWKGIEIDVNNIFKKNRKLPALHSMHRVWTLENMSVSV